MAIWRSPFTARPAQVLTYLLCVALFSISFLVFLNSSISFLIEDLIGQRDHVGDAVGTLGFADELVAIIACPLWGYASDKLGVRFVCVTGYTLVGLSLFVFVQTQNVYPQLLLARLLFSVGGAATATMVTAVLPAMTSKPAVISSQEDTIQGTDGDDVESAPKPIRPHSAHGTSTVAGLVGLFTGLGALVALFVFLPLPARFQDHGYTPQSAVKRAYYIVGAVALLVAFLCALGLHKLAGEQGKGWSFIIRALRKTPNNTATDDRMASKSPKRTVLLVEAARLGFTNSSISLGHIGGFVARASSVAISLFIPFFVKHYFTVSGLCPKSDADLNDPSEFKKQCRDAYIIASILTGSLETVALIFAPIFGYLDGRFGKYNIPLGIAGIAGVVGYAAMANVQNPNFRDQKHKASSGIFGIMALIGISQIGAIVCSLSVLSRGIQGHGDRQHIVRPMTQGEPLPADQQPLLSAPEPQNETAAPVQENGWTDLPDPVYGAWRGEGVAPNVEQDRNIPAQQVLDEAVQREAAGQDSSNVLHPDPLLSHPTHATNGTRPYTIHPTIPVDADGAKPDALTTSNHEHLKGSIAGVYSFGGGVGILILTKLGGSLFDSWSPGAPFVMMAIFNGLLLLAAIGNAFAQIRHRRASSIAP